MNHDKGPLVGEGGGGGDMHGHRTDKDVIATKSLKCDNNHQN